MRWFRRKKKEKPEAPTEALEQPTKKTSVDVLSSKPEVEIKPVTNPVEAFVNRLDGILTEPEVAAKTKALKDTHLQIIAGGEPLLLWKKGVQSMSLVKERSLQSDVFIRMSDSAAGELAMTSTITEFKKLYKEMVSVRSTSSYITITLHTPLDALREKGYFSIELLRILIDA